MTKEDKLARLAEDFVSLPDEKQDYILGIMQALVFANDEREEKSEPADFSVSEQAG